MLLSRGGAAVSACVSTAEIKCFYSNLGFITLKNTIHLSLPRLAALSAAHAVFFKNLPLIFLHNTGHTCGSQEMVKYRLQLDEVQGSWTDVSGVRGLRARCQAISPIIECGRLTTFINIQKEQDEAAWKSCVAEWLTVT